MNPNTSRGAVRGAWEALLRGDTAERDRLCERAKVLIDVETKASAVERVMAVDFYVSRRGVVVPTKMMAKAAGILQ